MLSHFRPLYGAPERLSSLTALLLVIAWIAGTGQAPPEGRRHTLPRRTAPCSTVALYPGDGHTLAPVSVGGLDSLRFVLDTAAGRSVITPATRDRLGLTEEDGHRASVTGASGRATYQMLRLDSLRVGAYAARRIRVAVIDLERFERGAQRYDGILGNDFLRHFDFEYNRPADRLRLCRVAPGTASPLAGLTDTLDRVPFGSDAQRSGSGFVSLDLMVGDAPAEGLLDTGASTSVFNKKAARQDGFANTEAARKPGGTRGLGTAEASETHLYTFANVRAGSTRFKPTQVRVTDLPIFEARSLGNRAAVLLGNGLLKNRVVVVAYSTRSVYFSKPVRDGQ